MTIMLRRVSTLLFSHNKTTTGGLFGRPIKKPPEDFTVWLKEWKKRQTYNRHLREVRLKLKLSKSRLFDRSNTCEGVALRVPVIKKRW